MAKNKSVSKSPIGGQAVVEGILMRSGTHYSIACRKPSGKIVSQTKKFKSITDKCKCFKWPFIRGIFVLVEAMILGVKALIYSSNKQMQKSSDKMSWTELSLTLGLSVVFALGIFKFLPLLAANLFRNALGFGGITFNLVEGLVKFFIFLAYLLIISSMKDVRVMFQYHGAEHKAVNCQEAGKELTINNVKKYPKAQLRCGTSFLFMVILISILVYLVIPVSLGFWHKYLLRILLLPIISGVSYEAIKLSSKYPNWWLLHVLVSPGLLIQKITTKEPDKKQIEVAITALKNVLAKN